MIVSVANNHRDLRLPDFFIVGAAKSATTSLHSYLNQHPKIFLPKRKELYFFAFNGETPRFKLADGTMREKVGVTREEYLHIYGNSPQGCLLGDISSWYLYYAEEVIRNVQKFYGTQARQVKIIMVLRNPVDRAWSHYCMHRGQGLIGQPFRETILAGTDIGIDKGTGPAADYYPGYDYIGFGMYSRQVEAFLEAFDEVKIYLYEEFNKDSRAVVEDITRFLGLEPGDTPDTGKRLNISGAPRSSLTALVGRLVYRPYFLKKLIRPLIPKNLRYKIKTGIGPFLFKKKNISPEDRQALTDIFRQDIQRLQELLDRDLSAWLHG